MWEWGGGQDIWWPWWDVMPLLREDKVCTGEKNQGIISAEVVGEEEWTFNEHVPYGRSEIISYFCIYFSTRTWWVMCNSPHLTEDKETEVKRDQITCSRSHSLGGRIDIPSTTVRSSCYFHSPWCSGKLAKWEDQELTRWVEEEESVGQTMNGWSARRERWEGLVSQRQQ